MAMRGKEVPPHPRVALIDREWPVDAWAIANYYAIGTVYGGPPKDFTVIDRVRWATPAGDERQDVLSDEVLGILGGADVVWPLSLEDRLRAALAPFIADPECRRRRRPTFCCPSPCPRRAPGSRSPACPSERPLTPPPCGRDKNARKRRFPGQWALTFIP